MQHREDRGAAEADAGREGQLAPEGTHQDLEGIHDREADTIPGGHHRACCQSQVQVGRGEGARSAARKADRSLVGTGAGEDNREEFVEHLVVAMKVYEGEGLVRSLPPHQVQGPVATCSVSQLVSMMPKQ